MNNEVDGLSLVGIRPRAQGLRWQAAQARSPRRARVLQQHQPFFPDKYNNRWFTNEDKAGHDVLLWTTDYLIWANYDVTSNDQDSHVDNLSTNYLGTEDDEHHRSSVNDYQKAQLTLHSALPAINTTGYLDATGTIYLSSVKEDTRGGDAQTSLQKALQARSSTPRFSTTRSSATARMCTPSFARAPQTQTDPNLAPGTDANQVARAKGGRGKRSARFCRMHDVKTPACDQNMQGFCI